MNPNRTRSSRTLSSLAAVAAVVALGATACSSSSESGGAMGNFIVGHSKGNWTIQGDRADNLSPERNAPLDAASRRGAIDPLEATEPAAPPTEPTMQAPGSESTPTPAE